MRLWVSDCQIWWCIIPCKNLLHQEVVRFNAIFANPKPLHMSEKNEKDFQSAGSARKNSTMKKSPRVRDHCYILSLYRGSAHKICNMKLAIKPWIACIPVVLHNLKGYDSHLIMQQIDKITGRLSCIQNNTEKYISFSVGQLKFLGSFVSGQISLWTCVVW